MYEEVLGNQKWAPFYDVDQATTENAFLTDEKNVELKAEDGNIVLVDFVTMTQHVQYSESIVGAPHKIGRCGDLAKSITVVPKPEYGISVQSRTRTSRPLA